MILLIRTFILILVSLIAGSLTITKPRAATINRLTIFIQPLTNLQQYGPLIFRDSSICFGRDIQKVHSILTDQVNQAVHDVLCWAELRLLGIAAAKSCDGLLGLPDLLPYSILA